MRRGGDDLRFRGRSATEDGPEHRQLNRSEAVVELPAAASL